MMQAQYGIEHSKNNIKCVPLDMQKADYKALNADDARGEKVNESIKIAIRERMERDSASAKSPREGFGFADGASE